MPPADGQPAPRPNGDPEPVTGPPSGRAIEVAPRIRVAESAMTFTYSSSSGPGGQNVNKRATRAQLRVPLAELPIEEDHRERLRKGFSHLVTGDDVLITSDETRSQRRNRDRCLDKLREALLQSGRPPKRRRPTRPTRGSIERRLREKKARGERKQTRRRPDAS